MARLIGRRVWVGSSVLSLAVLAGLQPWLHGDAPVAAPASSPATKPAAPAGPATHTVKRGDLKLEIRSDAIFQPVDPFEVKTTFKQYTGPLSIASVAAPGAKVKKGDTIIAFERTWYDWQLSAAEGELAVARANLAKGEKDAEVAKTTDPLAIRMAEDGLKNAETAKAWWEKVDGPHQLQLADLGAKQAQFGFDDRNDELDQLRKMYGADELTAATADIVIRRAVRGLELAKLSVQMEGDRRDKIKAFEYNMNRQRVTDAAENAKHQLTLTKNQIEQSQVARKAGLAAAKVAVEQATRKLEELKADGEQLTFKAPADGEVAYGTITDGVWTGGDPKLFKVGEKLAAGQVLMRVLSPGKLRLVVNVPESQSLWIDKGATATVTPAALPQISYSAPVAPPELVSRQNPAGIAWLANVDVENPDPRLLPGMKASIVIDCGSVENGVVIPLSVVTGGKVRLKQPDGSFAETAVKLGKTDGTNVVVLEGLKEGDELALKK